MRGGVVSYSQREAPKKEPGNQAKTAKREGIKMKQYVKVIETGEIVEVYFRHADGIAYVGNNGVKIIFNGQFENVVSER